MVFAHVFLHLCRLFSAVAARAFARNARGKAAFRWWLGMSCVMVVPCLMPFLSVVLPVRLSRWVNILFGLVYTLVIVAVVALARGWYFYTMYGLIEIILSLLVVWYAWTWPKEASNR